MIETAPEYIGILKRPRKFPRISGRSYFFQRLSGEPPPAREPDEAWLRYEKKRKKMAAELRSKREAEENGENPLASNQMLSSNDQENGLKVGSQVVILHPKLGQRTFYIVKPEEVDLREGKISAHSPIAQSLIDHQAGEKVTVQAPAGPYRIEIVKLQTPLEEN